MDGQMNIFDFLSVDTGTDDFDTMTIEKAAELIGNATGLSFKKDDRWEDAKAYIAKSRGYLVSINFNNFAPGIRGGGRYLGTQIDKGTWGCGCPTESIEEAINWIKKHMK